MHQIRKRKNNIDISGRLPQDDAVYYDVSWCMNMGGDIDDFETHDVRTLLPGTMFSIEPGIYTDRIGVRLEYGVHITMENKLAIYGPIQDEILVI